MIKLMYSSDDYLVVIIMWLMLVKLNEKVVATTSYIKYQSLHAWNRCFLKRLPLSLEK